MFMTYILKLNNFIYLLWAFQLNKGFSWAGLPGLCLSGSLRLAVLVAVQGPKVASLSTFITAVTAWTATQLT